MRYFDVHWIFWPYLIVAWRKLEDKETTFYKVLTPPIF